MHRLGLFRTLADYTPALAGTIPLDVDIADSDLDVICEARDLDAFEGRLRDAFGGQAGFWLRRIRRNDLPAVVAGFRYEGFAIEVFGQPRPVQEQDAYRHMRVEARLLDIGGEAARRAIRYLKQAGLKTEPAFARYFRLGGDPFQRLLELDTLDEAALRALVGGCQEGKADDADHP